MASSQIKALSLLVLCVLSFTSVKSDQDSEIDPVTEFVPSALGKVQVSSQNDAGFTYLYAEFEASFTIPYKNSTEDELDAEVNMPGNASCSGAYDSSDCDSISLNCTWVADNTKPEEEWEFSMVFTVTENKGDKTVSCNLDEQDKWDIEYKVTGITLSFYMGENYFPDGKHVRLNHTMVEAGNSSLSLFEVSGDSSYKCEHLQTVDVLDSLVNITLGVNLQDYQVQAFQISSEKDTAEFDTAITCDLDEEGSSLVPIIVGCVLAGLIVLTLIAYFIGRWHQNRQGNYQAL
ncbi:uncharacterized protein LOC134839096 isoform X2 [Symsagittifera roscoffensis]|uniref:uncharacterized protein LOC134839096 isoform X2 n=1 Tax=Symsagittifera roscoffensis TaxID=84072 RepID=UPI00307BB41C